MENLQATGLRIGNLVYGIDEDFNRLPIKIGVGDLCDIECSIDNEGDYEPIPLTAEWLEKFGFSPAFHKISGEHSHLPTWYNLNGFQIDVSYFCGGENVCDYILNMNPSTELLYVHQLQNLFFALTGEELTIREDAK